MSVPTAAPHDEAPWRKSRALPEMCLFSMGQLLCVASWLWQIVNKPVKLTFSSLYAPLWARGKSLWIYYMPLLLQSYNCIGIGKRSQGLKYKVVQHQPIRPWIFVSFYKCWTVSVPRRIFSSTPFLGYPAILLFIHVFPDCPNNLVFYSNFKEQIICLVYYFNILINIIY